MDYQEALERLHSLLSFGVRPGLSRIQELLRRLGDPHRRIPSFIHVGGTNGKGSVSAMLDSMIRADGKQTGLFTSPHLHSHTERYRVNGQPIPEPVFANLFARVWSCIQQIQSEGWESPTEFEAATALAFLYFAECQVDVAVIEVGLGGDMDSTNVIPSRLQIITNVGMDHMAYLGSTIPEIARCKAGIIKPGSTVITGADGEALPVIADEVQQQGATLLTLGRDIQILHSQVGRSGSTVDLSVSGRQYRELVIPLLGRHQIANGALAVAGAQQVGIPECAIRKGLAATVWPGRLEIISQQPLVVLDGAHNAPATQVLSQALAEYWPEKRILCLIGMLADKQREESLAPLLPRLSRAIVTPPAFAERVGDWQRLVEICQAGGVPAQAVEDRHQACDEAVALVRAGEYDMLLVCGSLHLLADVRLYLLEAVKSA